VNGRGDGQVVLYAGMAGGSCEGRMVGPSLTPSHIRISMSMGSRSACNYFATGRLCISA
jgi:hypothetical protein